MAIWSYQWLFGATNGYLEPPMAIWSYQWLSRSTNVFLELPMDIWLFRSTNDQLDND